jgi:transposase
VVGLILELAKRIEEMENQKAKNSKNSDKPPSGDGFGKQTKSLRVFSGKQTGGQQGHEGHNLKWVQLSDQVIRHEVKACE